MRGWISLCLLVASTTSPVAADGRLVGPAPGAGFGQAVACCDVNGDKLDDVVVGAPFANPNGLFGAGSVFVYSGRDFSLLRRLDGLAAGDAFGFTIACGRVNRDKFGDLVIGARFADPNGINAAGSVFVYSGRDFRLLKRLDGASDLEVFGTALACCNVNGDKFADVVVGAPFADPGGLDSAGSVFVYSGASFGLLQRLDGPAAGDNLGHALACCDINRDKRDDLVVGAPLTNPNGLGNTGSVLVYSGANFSLLRRFDGLEVGDEFGAAVSCCFVNGDKFADVVVGARFADPGGLDSAGSVFVYSGRDFSLVRRLDGREAFDLFGLSVVCCDVTGDKFGDLIVGANPSSPNGRNAGSIFIYSGRDFIFLRRRDGPETGDLLGRALACGFVNRNRFADLVVGLPGADPNGMTGAGEVYVLFGSVISP